MNDNTHIERERDAKRATETHRHTQRQTQTRAGTSSKHSSNAKLLKPKETSQYEVKHSDYICVLQSCHRRGHKYNSCKDRQRQTTGSFHVEQQTILLFKYRAVQDKYGVETHKIS